MPYNLKYQQGPIKFDPPTKGSQFPMSQGFDQFCELAAFDMFTAAALGVQLNSAWDEVKPGVGAHMEFETLNPKLPKLPKLSPSTLLGGSHFLPPRCW